MPETASLPEVTPPPRWSKFSSFIRSKALWVASKLLYYPKQFNDYIATTLRTTSWRVLQFEIAGAGATAMQVGEWFFALLCFGILLAIWITRIARQLHHPFGAVGRFVHSAFAVIVCILLIAVADLRKPENEPWSNLQKLWKKNAAIKETEYFPFLMGAPLGDSDSATWEIGVRPYGPLLSSYNCEIKLTDFARKHLEEVWLSTHPGQIPPLFRGRASVTDIRVDSITNFDWYPVDLDHQHYSAKINCPNRSFDEDWEVARINGALRTKLTLRKIFLWEAPQIIYSCIDHVSAQPDDHTDFKPQDLYVTSNPDWKPNHLFQFPVSIIPSNNNPRKNVWTMSVAHPGCWECLQNECGGA
jgi:hypothetical protein